jgi:two-component system LytT family sensor kinase
MQLALGVLLGIGLAAVIVAAWWAARHRRSEGIPQAAMQSALHAAISTLPHLRRGLTPRSAERAVPHLRALTGAAAIALADTTSVLAIDGQGREQVRPGDLLSKLLSRTGDDRVHLVSHLVSSDPSCPLRSAVLAPVMVHGRRAGTLIAFYRSPGRPSHHELRVVLEAAGKQMRAMILLGVNRRFPRRGKHPP